MGAEGPSVSGCFMGKDPLPLALIHASMLGSPDASFLSRRVNYLIRCNLRLKRNCFFLPIGSRELTFS